MTEHHPPMTGLESQFEDELNEHSPQDHQREQPVAQSAEHRQPDPESPADEVAEEAMHLGR